jgi:hypothetical protein
MATAEQIEASRRKVEGAWNRRNLKLYERHGRLFQREQERHLARVAKLRAELEAALDASRAKKFEEENAFFASFAEQVSA